MLIVGPLNWRRHMPRNALVTGGTRGIGAAIAEALKAAGYDVAANYGGNDEAAAKFKAETGIPVYKRKAFCCSTIYQQPSPRYPVY